MRADLFLFTHGLAESRSQASVLIDSGVFLDGKRIPKASFLIEDATDPSRIVIGCPMKYVSRGGLKLEAALERFGISVSGLTALDIGASTGGFTDCLLRHGASFVYALDVGHGQLVPSLRDDTRVLSLEGINAREMTPALFDKPIGIAVTDVSFISQTLIFPALSPLLSKGTPFISLIKPQFEAGRAAIGKNGIVKKPEDHIAAIRHVFAKASESGLFPHAVAPSPIAGGDGNREYIALFRKDFPGCPTPDAESRAVKEAFARNTL